MTRIYFSIAAIFVFFLSCNSFRQHSPSFSDRTETVIAKVIRGDSLPKPVHFKATRPAAIPAGHPDIIMTHNNVSIAGEPEMMITVDQGQVIPGTNGCPLPSKVIAVHKKRRALAPEVVVAGFSATTTSGASALLFL